MNTFHLQIVTPDGPFFDGEAEMLIVRTIAGDVGILANHIDFVTALGMGRAKVVIDGTERIAACIGGLLTVSGGSVKLVATTFEWADQIDIARAEAAQNRAKATLDNKNLSESEMKLAEARLKRALVRLNVAKK